MVKETVQKDGGGKLELSTSNNTNGGTGSVGTWVSKRPRKPTGCAARKCSACHNDASTKTEQKRPQRSSGDSTKSAAKKTTLQPPKNASDVKRRRSLVAGLSSVSIEEGSPSSQVRDVCRNESTATETVSANTVSAPRYNTRASVAKKKETVEQEIPQARQSTRRKRPAAPPNEIGVSSATPKQIARKKAEVKPSDEHKASTTGAVSLPPAGSSKQSSKAIDSSPSTSKSKKSTVPKKNPGKEPKSRSSPGLRISKEKAEAKASIGKLKASIGKLKASTDSHSSSTDSDTSSDTYCEHHIRWPGSDDYKVGQTCCFCEKDLSIASWEDQESEYSNLPVVAVLPCGHVFHYHCLNVTDFTEEEGDPPCVLCASYDS